MSFTQQVKTVLGCALIITAARRLPAAGLEQAARVGAAAALDGGLDELVHVVRIFECELLAGKGSTTPCVGGRKGLHDTLRRWDFWPVAMVPLVTQCIRSTGFPSLALRPLVYGARWALDRIPEWGERGRCQAQT